MLCTVASMLTTTPRFRPWAEAMPSPATRSSPSGSTSATTAITFAVPMSRPTTRSLYSLAMFRVTLSFPSAGGRGLQRRGDALEPHRIAFVVAQVGVDQRSLVARDHLRQRAEEALDARLHLVVAAAAELDLGAAVELGVPRAASAQRQRVHLELLPREQRREPAEHREHL